MKKIILMTLMAVGLAFSPIANGQTSTPLFAGNELGISVGSGYTFGQTYSLNFQGGVDYFATKYFGGEVFVPFYTKNSVAVSSVGAGFLARLPVQITLPLINKPLAIAPLIGVDSKYDWQAKTFDYTSKGGLECRLTKSWSVVGEGTWTFDKWNNIKGGNAGALVSLKLLL